MQRLGNEPDLRVRVSGAVQAHMGIICMAGVHGKEAESMSQTTRMGVEIRMDYDDRRQLSNGIADGRASVGVWRAAAHEMQCYQNPGYMMV